MSEGIAKSSGQLGEDYAVGLLEAKGYRILARNFHSRWGEIDIIALQGEYLIFAEVKTRRPGAMGDPFSAVTPAKRQKLMKTAACYWQQLQQAGGLHMPEGEIPCKNLQPRFDVIALWAKAAGGRLLVERAEHLENAMEGEGFYW